MYFVYVAVLGSGSSMRIRGRRAYWASLLALSFGVDGSLDRLLNIGCGSGVSRTTCRGDCGVIRIVRCGALGSEKHLVHINGDKPASAST